MALLPRHLYEAALADLARVRDNARIRADRKEAKLAGAKPSNVGTATRLSFLPMHVRGKLTASAVIKAALDDWHKGAGSKDRLQAALYDQNLLWRAHEYALSIERGENQGAANG